jgi:hypothetical protein
MDNWPSDVGQAARFAWGGAASSGKLWCAKLPSVQKMAVRSLQNRYRKGNGDTKEQEEKVEFVRKGG